MLHQWRKKRKCNDNEKAIPTRKGKRTRPITRPLHSQALTPTHASTVRSHPGWSGPLKVPAKNPGSHIQQSPHALANPLAFLEKSSVLSQPLSAPRSPSCCPVGEDITSSSRWYVALPFGFPFALFRGEFAQFCSSKF